MYRLFAVSIMNCEDEYNLYSMIYVLIIINLLVYTAYLKTRIKDMKKQRNHLYRIINCIQLEIDDIKRLYTNTNDYIVF